MLVLEKQHQTGQLDQGPLNLINRIAHEEANMTQQQVDADNFQNLPEKYSDIHI